MDSPEEFTTGQCTQEIGGSGFDVLKLKLKMIKVGDIKIKKESLNKVCLCKNCMR